MDETKHLSLSDIPVIVYGLLLMAVLILLIVFDPANPTIRWSDYFLPTFTAVMGAMGAEKRREQAPARSREPQPRNSPPLPQPGGKETP